MQGSDSHKANLDVQGGQIGLARPPPEQGWWECFPRKDVGPRREEASRNVLGLLIPLPPSVLDASLQQEVRG